MGVWAIPANGSLCLGLRAHPEVSSAGRRYGSSLRRIFVHGTIAVDGVEFLSGEGTSAFH